MGGRKGVQFDSNPFTSPKPMDLTMNIDPISLRLTKKAFLALTSGCFLASNVMTEQMIPVFSDTVPGSLDERREQWLRIVSVGADQRLCRIFQSQQECMSWFAAVISTEAASTPSFTHTTSAPKLTDAEEEQIIDKLTQNPDESISFYGSQRDEELDSRTYCYFAAIKRGALWNVYSYEQSEDHDGDLVFGEAFETRKAALARAREWAEETRAAAEEALNEEKDAKWAELPPATSELAGPFRFTDNTDFQDGWELENEAEVFRFFRRHDYLMNPDEWGNMYSCGLVDDSGTPCWVSMNHREEMRLYAE